MTVRFYSSGDASAPALRGNTPGDLINLLTKCLVDGYGAKSGAGWTKPYAGTNLAVFRTGAGSNGMCLRIDDTSVDASNRAARALGFESMTDVNTGTGRFPLNDQESGGLMWFTHYSGSPSNARQWFLIADEGFMVLMIQTFPEQLASSSQYYRETYWFGDLVPIGPADAYATVIQGKPAGSSGNTSESHPLDSVGLNTSSSGLYIARTYTGLGGSLRAGKAHDSAKSGTTAWGGNGNLPYPHGPDGALLMSPVWVHEPGSTSMAAIRGTLPGIWAPLQYVLQAGDTFAGQGDLTGRSFFAWRQYENRMCVETTDTWR
ncbi:hypothetical protein KWH04_01220 [Xanthomonas campestris pv. trichodesmae]|uniref:Phage tail protein n=2 Tax=Xanthomonas citri TaxID=346 RepID=A0AB33CK77_XANCI|nr:hypothetical protein [Xanthomonas citri]ASK91041.1 hypothetical protein XcvCFBP7111P_05595 [Xanthomonas citri pv. vignicola]MBV6779291.1 hypothetical protein [Xanthomonas campestris pv. trichodesmae]MBZ3921804.1 hypothetical protein [Xanthomonas campestris pv. trichodesmae]MBZ3926404.1 hypothetical protein [Xanthomonas citri pv. sesbaniae]